MPELSVQPGGKVAMRSGGVLGATYSVHRVASVDGRGIITLENGKRYRSDGSPLEKGEKWHRPDPIIPLTDEIQEAIEKSHLVSSLEGLKRKDWEAMDIQRLRAISEIINAEH